MTPEEIENASKEYVKGFLWGNKSVKEECRKSWKDGFKAAVKNNLIWNDPKNIKPRHQDDCIILMHGLNAPQCGWYCATSDKFFLYKPSGDVHVDVLKWKELPIFE